MTDLTVEDVIQALHELRRTLRTHPDDWQHETIEDYLEAIEAWLKGAQDRAPARPSWEFVIALFRMGKIYE